MSKSFGLIRAWREVMRVSPERADPQSNGDVHGIKLRAAEGIVPRHPAQPGTGNLVREHGPWKLRENAGDTDRSIGGTNVFADNF